MTSLGVVLWSITAIRSGRQRQAGAHEQAEGLVVPSHLPAARIQSGSGRTMRRENRIRVTEVNVLSADRFNYVKVETDEGIHGVGELHPTSGTGGTPFLPIAGVHYCAEYLVGKNPHHIERHWQHMFRRSLFRGGPDIMAAIGAIDIALWDIKGKSYGKPVYEAPGRTDP